MVLLGQHFGRRHQRGLRAGLDRAQHREQRNQRLARADIALQEPQHAPLRTHVALDLGQRLELVRGRTVAEARERPGLQRAVAAQAPAAAAAHPAAHERERELPGQQLVVREAAPRLRARDRVGGCLNAAERVEKAGPALAAEQGGIVPLGQLGHARESPAHRGCDLARPQSSRQRPHRLDQREPFRLVGKHHVIGMWQSDTVPEPLELAGHDEFRAGWHLGLPREAEEDEFRESRAVRHDHAPGLAGVERGFVADHLHRERRDRPRPGTRDHRPGAAVDIGFRHVEQQVEHPVAPGRARDQAGQSRSYATQSCQRREKRRECVVFHGLTLGDPAAI